MHEHDSSATDSSSIERDDGNKEKRSTYGDASKDVGGGGGGASNGRLPSSSHYSTEKSGSSGYYSSNVYSASSIEDHIYSEPVIDAIDQTSTPKIRRPRDHRRKFDQKLDQHIGLANLEKSVKSLEKHLKLLSRQQQQQQQQQHSKQSACEMCGCAAAEMSTTVDDEKTKRLPTIVEGIDTNGCTSVAAGKAKSVRRGAGAHGWPTDTDDSLMDLDFESFRKVNEKRDKKQMKLKLIGGDGSAVPPPDNGIENPTSEPDDDDDDDDRIAIACSDHSKKHIENNYKCTKYVNSCPDDPYNVEGVNDYKYPMPRTATAAMSFLVKSTDPQALPMVHGQKSTKDILEEIHGKLSQLLSQPTDHKRHSITTDTSDSDAVPIATATTASVTMSETDSLKNNIQTLQQDLENYLKMINEQNEKEIRQFCSGLSQNYKLLTMQHALANKRRKKMNLTLDVGGSDAYSSRSFCSSSRHSGGSTSSYFNEFVLPTHYGRYDDALQRKTSSNDDDDRPSKLFRSRTESQEFVRYSSGSDNNFQLQRRHSDSLYSSWDEERHSGTDDITNARNTDNVVVEVPATVDVTTAAAANAVGHIEQNLAMQQPIALMADGDKHVMMAAMSNDEKELMLDLMHRNKPSIWQQYYGSKRLKYSNVVKKIKGKLEINPAMTYVSRQQRIQLFHSFFSLSWPPNRSILQSFPTFSVPFRSTPGNDRKLHSICTN